MGRMVEMLTKGKNFAAGTVGALEAGRLGEFAFTLPDGGAVPGKVFLAEALGASGMEVSFQVMPPKMSMPFFHKHRKNEEIYLVLKGSGVFDIDGEAVPVAEGAAIRISPEGSRSWRNTGSEAMIVLCVQAAAGTLSAFTGSDGVIG